MLKLLEFDFTIEYKKGADNKVADALSRQFTDQEEVPETDHTCLVTTTAIPTWTEDITKSYSGDAHCTKLLEELAIDPTSHPRYSLHSGILRHKGRLYIGTTGDLKNRVFNSFHSSIFGGHSGNRVTHHRLKQLFYWPKMKQYLTKKIAECPVCQISKTERVQYPGLLDPLPIPKRKWAEISIDFVEGLPTSKGKNVILVVVDRLTKYAHFLPLSHPYTVQKVATLLINNIVKLHGPPTVITSDRDRIFQSKIWKEIFSALQIELNFSTAYHPQSDGQTERVNQCLEQYLRCMAFAEPKKWMNWLAAAEWWYNCSYHTAIKMSPFEALYEYPPPLLTALPITSDFSPEAQEILTEQDHMLKVLQQNLAKAQSSMKKFADNHRTARSFKIGDMVYLKMQPHREHALGSGNPLKLASKWYGPYKVLQTVGNRAYKLQLPEGTQIHDVFHVSQLKQHLGPCAVPNKHLPLVTPTGKLKINPVAILQRRQVPRNTGEYDVPVPQWLIQWQGMAEDEATWEDASFIQATFPAFKALKPCIQGGGHC
jgi:hypothetical protein